MKRIAMVIAFLALATPTFAQTQVDLTPPPFGERVDVNAVLLDVIVTDKKGNHILGLTKDDFLIKENGSAMEVDSVDYLTNRQLLDSREGDAPFKVDRVHENRYFIFFFDRPTEPGQLFDQLTRARQAVKDIVRDEMKETDVVAIVGHDVRLKVYSDFTNDKKQIERALDESSRFGNGLTEAPKGETQFPSILREVDRSSMMKRTGTVYQALELVGDAVRSIRARKNLVLFSPGMRDIGEQVYSGMIMDRSPKVDSMLQSLNGGNVAVYSVQLAQRTEPGSDLPIYHQRLSELAQSTGGRYFEFNTSFKPAIDNIEEINAGYYLVTYRSKKAQGEKGYQKVDVSVKNPEFRVVARSGYEYGQL